MASKEMFRQCPSPGESGYVQDDDLINDLLNGGTIPGEIPGDFNFGDTVGKVDDAVNYEDISDDDLLLGEESPSLSATAQDFSPASNDDDLCDMMEEGKEGTEGCEPEIDFDDLFGDSEFVNDSVLYGNEDLDMSLAVGGFYDGISSTTADADEQTPLFPGDSAPKGSPEMEIPSQAYRKERTPGELVKQYFPDFEPHKILSFSSLFRPKATTLSVPFFNPPKVCVPAKINFEMATDDQMYFIKATNVGGGRPREGRSIIEIPQDGEDMGLDGENTKGESRGLIFDRDLVLACDDWESKLDAMMTTPPLSPKLKRAEAKEAGTRDSHRDKRIRHLNNFIDTLPDSWLDEDAIFNGNLTSICAQVTLDLNDPRLLVDIYQPHEISRTRRIGGEFKRRVNKDLTQRYNISNDEAYDMLNMVSRNQVRSAIGQLEIEHSMPALKFQSPFYREKLSIKEQRAYHRPNFAFDLDLEYRFEKVEHRKKKAYHKLPIQNVFKTAKDLSLQDDLPFVLLEYSEEHPTVLSNFGMGSRIINYYRRNGPQDVARPKRDIGETQVLLSQDRSPFWNFGTVNPGEVVPTIYNGMFRAPIFQQPVKSTDFLVVRNTNNNQVHHFLRTIPHIFVVGQLLPVTDVPGPHSRKVTTASKNRLRMICYRILKHKKEKVMTPKEIAPHFPESTELQNRQKVKDALERVGGGLWKMRTDENFPTEESIRSLVKPEDLCLLEAMQVGLRNLADAGYSRTLEGNDEIEGEKDGMSIEQQLKPWVSSKSFIEATQGKAMLQLHGEGDPTGRGEAFSFVKTSMKGGFRAVGESVEEDMDKERLRELGGHKYNVARQQREYTEAITRIWQAQKSSLSCTEPPELEIEDEHGDGGDDPSEEGKVSTADDESVSQFTRFSSVNQGNRLLKIVRTVRNKWDEIEKVEEIITDPKVIKQYMQRRRELDAEKTNVAEIVRTGNKQEDEINRRRMRDELARLQRNKERRELRERQAKRTTIGGGDFMCPNGASPDFGAGSPTSAFGAGSPTSAFAKGATPRKCAGCGQVGHIRTNRKVCPKLNGSWERLGMSPPPKSRQRSESRSTPVSS